VTDGVDDDFYARADAHIHLSNDQLKNISRGKVSASMMYSVARFNAWVSATNSDSRQDMLDARERIIGYFTGEYRKMLEENLDDYIKHFDSYTTVSPKNLE